MSYSCPTHKDTIAALSEIVTFDILDHCGGHFVSSIDIPQIPTFARKDVKVKAANSLLMVHISSGINVIFLFSWVLVMCELSLNETNMIVGSDPISCSLLNRKCPFCYHHLLASAFLNIEH